MRILEQGEWGLVVGGGDQTVATISLCAWGAVMGAGTGLLVGLVFGPVGSIVGSAIWAAIGAAGASVGSGAASYYFARSKDRA